MTDSGRRPAGVAALVDETGRVVCARCELADRALTRMRGLLGRNGLAEGAGLLITRTSSIHTFFMAFPIDAVFLDRHLRVRSVVADVRPFRVVLRPGARNVLELPAGAAARAGIREGDRLAWHHREG